MSERKENVDHLALWKSVERTDPGATKNFTKGGGFKGTAISPMWLIKRATEQWGPLGRAWGVRIVEEKIVEGAPLLNEKGEVVGRESVHQIQIELFFPNEGRVPAFGQTQFVGRNKYGFFTDEEAPKKSLTDALTKALSWLGFAADVHMGLFDDVKYVAELKRVFEEQHRTETASDLRTKSMASLEIAAAQGNAALDKAWAVLSEPARKACQTDMPALTVLRQRAKEVGHAVACA